EVIAVNQASLDNRPLFDRDGLIAWLARPEDSADRYLALFNARDPEPPAEARQGESAAGPGLAISVRSAELGLEGALQVRDLWCGQELGAFDGEFAATVPWHGARLFRITGRAARPASES